MRWKKAWHPRRIAADGKGGMKMRLNAFLDRREHFSRAIAVERVCRRQVVVQRGIEERKNNEDREKQREIKEYSMECMYARSSVRTLVHRLRTVGPHLLLRELRLGLPFRERSRLLR